jgi:hypothetical protein
VVSIHLTKSTRTALVRRNCIDKMLIHPATLTHLLPLHLSPPSPPPPTENCLLRFIQIALIDCGGDGRAINSARARELGATVEISE